MKKLFMFLAVAGLATFGVSCSSSDDSNPGKDDDNPGGVKTLALSADKKEIKEGESVTFTVKVGDKVESGAEFYIGSDKISNPHKFDAAGEYKVVAKKEGFKDSNTVTVKVTKEGVDPEPEVGELVLSLVTNPADVIAGKMFEMSIVDGDGKPVTGAELYANGQPAGQSAILSKDGKFEINGPEGTYAFSAVKGDVESNQIEVKINPAPIAGTFTFEGTDYDINENYLVLMGVGTVSETDPTVYSVWSIESVNRANNLVSLVRFTTPATENADKTYSVVMPDGTNEQGVLAAILDISNPNNQVSKGQTNQVNVKTALTQLQEPVATGKFDADAVKLGTGAFTLSYEGDSTFINDLNAPAMTKSRKVSDFSDMKKELSFKSTSVSFNSLN